MKMLTNKTFSVKTKKGNILKIVQEHYLRDDISCAVKNCSNCTDTFVQKSIDPNLPILIPDTNVILHQIDLIEHHSFVNFVLLQTVLEEVRHRSLPIYNRLRLLTKNADRACVVFSNEYHKDCFVKNRETGESINDRNDRAIRVAAVWYANHVKSFSNSSKIILITDDKDNRQKALSNSLQNFIAKSVVEHVEGLQAKFPELVDMIASQEEMDSQTLSKKSKILYEDHISLLFLSAGLKNGILFQGSLNVNTHNYLEGSIFATIDGQDATIIISGRENMNRSIHGDTVAVKLLPKSQWKSDSDSKVLDERDDTEVATDSQDLMDVDTTNKKPTGKIVGIIKRNWRPYCGTLERQSSKSSETTTQTSESVSFWAFDKRIPKIRIKTRQFKNLVGKRVVVGIDSWNRDQRNPQGHFIRSLGKVGDKETETEMLLVEFDVPFAPFAPSVNACLPIEGEKWLVNDERDLKGRIDFRGLDICSIDPPGCTDIDDALHARPLDNGNYEVGVHIADVSHFVKPGNAMDDEAARRGTTVYLVDKRIDMLPGLLGTSLCSLHSNVERLAFSVIWEMTKEGEIVDVKYSKSIIKSRASFTYDEAQARLDDVTKTDPISVGIKLLNLLAKKLRKKRMEKGALVLASPEVRFNLENDSQDPVDVEMKELKDTNALVEEFMLLANIYVAKKIVSIFPDSSMLRRHPKPPSQNFDALIKACKQYDVDLDVSSSKALADSLDLAVVVSEPYFNKLVRIMTTRCMMQAVYFCSGTISEQEFWHYGLATDIYTHFTSPIRRYADLIVHRLLSACIGYDKQYSSSLTDKSHQQELSTVLNYRHRQAQQASRSSVELYTNLFFKNKVPVLEDGYVNRVMKNGIGVLIPRYGIEGFVKVDEGKMVFDPEMSRLTSLDGKIVVKLFGKVGVKVFVEMPTGDGGGQRDKLVVEMVDPVLPK